MSMPSSVSVVNLVITAMVKKNSASRPGSAPTPTAATNSSAHNRSGKARMMLLNTRKTA